MHGTVIGFSRDLKTGYILGDDGLDYIFTHRSWQSVSIPRADLKVTFESASGEALNVILN